MRLPTTRQLLVCLALTGTFGHVGAAELRQMPVEAAPAADPVPVPVDRLEDVDIDAAAAAHAQRPQRPRAQAPSPARAAGDSRAMPSRFHSFLPGMFR